MAYLNKMFGSCRKHDMQPILYNLKIEDYAVS